MWKHKHNLGFNDLEGSATHAYNKKQEYYGQGISISMAIQKHDSMK